MFLTFLFVVIIPSQLKSYRVIIIAQIVNQNEDKFLWQLLSQCQLGCHFMELGGT